jgi:hypothetical protein
MNVNQWAFSAITGYEGPDAACRSASVDDWEEMSLQQLEAQADGMFDSFPPEADVTGSLDTKAVAVAVQQAARAQRGHDWYEAFASLADEE